MKRLTFYPFFLSLFVILAIYVANVDDVSWRELGWPVVVVTVITAVLLGITALIYRSFHRAAIFTAAAVFFFLTYRLWVQGVWRIIGPLNPTQADAVANRLLCLAGVVLVWIAYCAGFRIRQPPIWTRRLNHFASILLAGPVLLWIFHIVSARGWLGLHGGKSTIVAIHSQPAGQAQPPDIYLIIADAHGRQDVLRDMYHYDDGPFLEHLREQGFFVADASHGNYAYTQLSIASMLNMRFLDEFNNLKMTTWIYVLPLLRHNTLVATLKAAGYRYVTFQTVLDDLCFTNSDDYVQLSTHRTLGNFAQLLLDTSLLSRCESSITSWLAGAPVDVYQEKRDTILFELSQMPNVAALPGPKFVFMHLLCPHAPYVFAADGSDPRQRGYGVNGDPGINNADYTVEMYRDWYAQQARYIDNQLSGMVDQIRARSATPPIIVLLSDHGPRSEVHWASFNPYDSNLRECMSNLTAIYLPPRAGLAVTVSEPSGLYPSITPVNIFRVILNDYFGAKLPLLPDKVYFSCPWIFAFHDVTTAVHDVGAQTAANEQAPSGVPPAAATAPVVHAALDNR